MNTAQNTASVALAAACALSNNGTLVLLSGAMPATPETALSGNTPLATATYSATAFGAPSFSGGNMQAAGSFTGNVNPAANGGCTFARQYKSDGTTAIADYTVGSTWIASNVTAVGQYCTNGGNTYVCATAGTTASSGGPTGTGSGIVDGSVHWNYVGAGQLFDLLMGNCNVQVGTAVSCTQTLEMEAA
ncbi:MAG TPA: hypothetical protein VFW75_16915 [Acetobacteraceae bacterium]|nr:hypothetical protein [Acetobacteraceae bacterium]